MKLKYLNIAGLLNSLVTCYKTMIYIVYENFLKKSGNKIGNKINPFFVVHS